jgi:hypothetical protein
MFAMVLPLLLHQPLRINAACAQTASASLPGFDEGIANFLG